MTNQRRTILTSALASAALIFFLAPFAALLADTASTAVSVVPPAQCDDGADNDGDSRVDYLDDPGCGSPTDNDETDPVYQCADALDNDGDGAIDFPDDLGCESATDDESDDPVSTATQPTITSGGSSRGRSAAAPGRGTAAPVTNEAAVTLTGVAQPNGKAFVVLDGILRARVGSGADGVFSAPLGPLPPGKYRALVYGTDERGVRSGGVSFPLEVETPGRALVSGVLVPPTLSVVRAEDGSDTIFGMTAPKATVETLVLRDDAADETRHVASDARGRYRLAIDADAYAVRTRVVSGDAVSPFGLTVHRGVESVVPAIDVSAVDINGDNRVNIIDLPLFLYWYWYAPLAPPPHIDFDGDGAATLSDISILLFYWTG